MEVWPPELIFFASFAVAAIGGLGRLLQSELPLTPRSIVGAILFHGCIGGGFAGLGYEYLRWKGRPMAMLGVAALYGGGVITLRHITGVFERALGLQRGPDRDDRRKP